MGRRPSFDVDAVAAAGLRVVRRRGWATVSLGAVAEELAVTPMALYRVVADADQLRQVVADAAAEALVPVEVTAPLLDALHGWALEAHDHLCRLPGLATYVIREWTELPSWLVVVESFLAAADEQGLPPEEAVETVNAVFAFVLARAQLVDGVTRQRRLAPLRATPDRYPHLRAERHLYEIAHTDDAFRFGLDALCRGIASAPTGKRR